jgi:organic hydroperoxide reductase OsmC/OhrA
VIAEGLTGIAAEDFAEVAKAAEAGCPVSNAYRGSMTVTLETTVK